VRDEKERLEPEEGFLARLAPLIERLAQLLDPPAEQSPAVVFYLSRFNSDDLVRPRGSGCDEQAGTKKRFSQD
jgi:hypothetical protein